MDMKGWSSRLKKKFKHPGSKRKPDRTGVESGGKSVDSANSLSQLLPHAVKGGSYNQEDGGTNLDGQQARSTDGLPPTDVSEQVPSRGGDNDQEGEGGGIDGGEASQMYPRTHPEFEVAMGSRLGQGGNGADAEKVEQVHPSPSTPSIPRSGKPDGGM